MTYASASDVAILSPHLIGGTGASTFSTTSSPTLNAVNTWLSAGDSVINSKLASRGYDPIGSSSGAYGIAQQIAALYGAWMAEMSLLSSRVSKMENSRADVFKKNFFDLLNMLCGLDLSNMGVGRSLAPPSNYAGGISVSDKNDNDNDPDIVQPRFERGQFQNSETVDPKPTGNARQAREDSNE